MPILHPEEDRPLLNMNRVPAEFFQTGLLGAPEALLLVGRYNPPSEYISEEMFPVT